MPARTSRINHWKLLSSSSQYLHLLILFHIILFLFFIAPGEPATTKASDVLDKRRNITDGDTLVSAGGTFTLGFFSPAGVPTKRYLGIWFSFSADAVYWVANRDHPLNGSSGVLAMSDSGSLVLLDGSGTVAWSSGSTSAPSGGAHLLESGNLVVYGQGTSTALWQSFDHPCNTMLPGMKIGKNLWTGAEWYLSSWRSAADPATGSFRYVTDANGGMPENLLLDSNNTKKYRTGPWNGKRFSGVPEMASFADMFTYQLTVSPSEVTYSYTAKAGAPFSRVVVNEAGVVQRLVWDANSRSWKTFFKAPRDECDGYAKCGAFGLCNNEAGSTSLCSCVRGFSSVSPSEWSMREYSGGCRQNVELDCGNKSQASSDGFEVMRGVKLPYTQDATVDMGINLDECRSRCLANCSCVAYAAADIQRGSGCVIWTKSFVDLRLIDDGQDIYRRLANSEIGQVNLGSKKVNKFLVPVLVAAASLLALSLWWLLRTKRKTPLPVSLITPIHQSLTSSPVTQVIIPSIDYETLYQATDHFSEGMVIGQGSFGTVYKDYDLGYVELKVLMYICISYALKAMLHESESTITGMNSVVQAAVKMLRQSDMNDRELRMMSGLTHVNLVRLLACCNHKTLDSHGREEKVLLLVYEYMSKGSLHKWIFGTVDERAELNWTRRIKIITSIAEGVLYLHVGSGLKIIHRDLKPANILLDDDWTPKIADFGLAKHVTDPNAIHTPIGPYGYFAPECCNGKTTEKSDVYSLGVVILEIISGRENGVMQELLLLAWSSWNNPLELLDEKVPLSQEEDQDEIRNSLQRCIHIGLLCVQKSPDDRPDIAYVVDKLRGTGSLRVPRRPTLRENGETSNTRGTNDHT